jgi:hypothetical protein
MVEHARVVSLAGDHVVERALEHREVDRAGDAESGS